MIITKHTVEELADLRKEHLDADIIAKLADRLGIGVRQATGIYYRSRLAQQINDGTYDIQSLAADYLVDDLLRYESDTLGLTGDAQSGSKG